METLSLNPIVTTTVAKQKEAYSFSIVKWMVTICVVAAIAYGLTQMEFVVAFYESLMIEIGQLEKLLSDPARFLQ